MAEAAAARLSDQCLQRAHDRARPHALPRHQVGVGFRQGVQQPFQEALLQTLRPRLQSRHDRARDHPRQRRLRRPAHPLRGELRLGRLPHAARRGVRRRIGSRRSSKSRPAAFSPTARATATRPARERSKSPRSSSGIARISRPDTRAYARASSSLRGTRHSSPTRPKLKTSSGNRKPSCASSTTTGSSTTRSGKCTRWGAAGPGPGSRDEWHSHHHARRMSTRMGAFAPIHPMLRTEDEARARRGDELANAHRLSQFGSAHTGSLTHGNVATQVGGSVAVSCRDTPEGCTAPASSNLAFPITHELPALGAHANSSEYG